jgi:hypothetical protein
MGVLDLRRADAVGSNQRDDAGERFGESMRVPQAGFQQACLAN